MSLFHVEGAEHDQSELDMSELSSAKQLAMNARDLGRSDAANVAEIVDYYDRLAGTIFSDRGVTGSLLDTFGEKEFDKFRIDRNYGRNLVTAVLGFQNLINNEAREVLIADDSLRIIPVRGSEKHMVDPNNDVVVGRLTDIFAFAGILRKPLQKLPEKDVVSRVIRGRDITLVEKIGPYKLSVRAMRATRAS